jgi:hypothetical protein
MHTISTSAPHHDIQVSPWHIEDIGILKIITINDRGVLKPIIRHDTKQKGCLIQLIQRLEVKKETTWTDVSFFLDTTPGREDHQRKQC